MLGLIRAIIGLVFVIAGTYAVKKSKIINKRKWTFFISLFTAVLISASCLLPIENRIIIFSSPEKAYSYFYSKDVELIVNGNETDFVVGQKHGIYSYLILPKTEEGWKTATDMELKLVCNKRFDGITVANIYKHRNYDDLYVVISGIEGNQNEISDNAGSEFYSIESAGMKNYYLYFAYINNSGKPYCVNINGEEFLLIKNIQQIQSKLCFMVV